MQDVYQGGKMNQTLTRILSAIHAMPDRPHHTCPGYEHWLAEQVFIRATESATQVSGPKCAEAILEAAGMACCDNNE